MQNVLLTIHLIACIALVISVMLQRSEGGALGMGGGGTGGLISGRGAAGVLVRATFILAGVFFLTSIVMTRLNNDANNQPSILEREAGQTTDPFDTLNQPSTTPPVTTVPAAPSTTAPATTPSDAATTTPGAAPAPAPAAPTPDPLAPKSTPKPAAPATNTAPAPATTAPTTPATTPENGGSPTP